MDSNPSNPKQIQNLKKHVKEMDKARFSTNQDHQAKALSEFEKEAMKPIKTHVRTDNGNFILK